MFINNKKKLSEKIKDELLKYIENMRKDGEKKLPSEDNLSKMYNVSRTTIRTVLSELENDGTIVRKHGTGTFINDIAIPLHVQFSPVSLYIDMIKEFGYESKAVHIDKPIIIEDASNEIYEKLKIDKKEKLVYTKKLFYADDKPCVFCIDYFPLSLVEDEKVLEKIDDYDDSLFDFLKYELKRPIKSDQAEITTTTSDETEILKDYFPESAKSFLQLNCINFDIDEKPVLYAEEYIDTNLIRFFSLRKK